MRTFAIWFFGLIAGAFFGAIVGGHLQPYGDGGFLGFVGGMCLFVCLRLWLAPSKPKI